MSQFVRWTINIMWCMETTQIVQSNLYLSFVFTFSVNYVQYHNIHCIATYCDITVSWLIYHDAYRIVKFLAKPSPVEHGGKNKRENRYFLFNRSRTLKLSLIWTIHHFVLMLNSRLVKQHSVSLLLETKHVVVEKVLVSDVRCAPVYPTSFFSFTCINIVNC